MNDLSKIHKAGGKREGAGRKIGSGKFREQTSVLRIPTSQAPVIKDFLAAYQRKKMTTDLDVVTEFELPALATQSIELPLYSSKVSAGLPSPAEEHVEQRLDPNDFLIDKKDTTFFVTIQGYSMVDIGLLPGDKAVVDRSKIASIGDIILAVIDGEFTIKTLSRTKEGNIRLLPANSTGTYSPINITEEMNFEVWGVVTGSFRRFK
ncbi:LexA family protein [Methylotenera sp. L2L1]|uniref:LexA family protein n=1 Tax=Methylotenera sp. L2L1 TaxID=1502770 RepID=UPI000560D750|nr:translesion error-prone DNA polymerase V autoproteolytic subunit [Methylotenera sp. L2L1]